MATPRVTWHPIMANTDVKVSKVTRQVSKGADLATAVRMAQRAAERQAIAEGQYLIPGFRVYITVEQDFIPRRTT